MPRTIKGILAKTDDSYRLRYLLGKDDIDDITTAVLVLKKRLKKNFPELSISSFVDEKELVFISNKWNESFIFPGFLHPTLGIWNPGLQT